MRILLLLLALVPGLLLAPEVQAQVRFEVSGTSNTGYTSNRNPGGDVDDTTNETAAVADGFSEFGLGITGLTVSGRMLHSLRYELTGTVFFGDDQAASFQNNLSYVSLYELSPRIRLGLGFSGRQGRQGSFRVDPTEQVVEPRRAGTAWFLGFTGQQRLDFTLNSQWRLAEAFQTDWFIPTNNPFGTDGDLLEADAGQYSATMDFGLSAQRSFGSIGLTLGQRAQYLLNVLPNANPATDERAWLFSTTAGLRWDINRSWSAGVEVGFQLSAQGDFSQVERPGPLFRGDIGYRWQRWRAGFNAGYEQTPSVQVGTILEGATVGLNGVMPIGHARLRMWLEGSVGYTYSSPVGDIVLDNSGGLTAADAVDIHTIGVDVAYNWRFSEVMEAALRYQFGKQKSVGLVELGPSQFAQDFDVHVVMLQLNFNYPPRRNRRRRQRRLGGPSRVDQEEWDSIFDPTPGRNNEQAPPNSGGGSGS